MTYTPNEEGIIEVEITDEMYAEAEAKAADLGDLGRNSIRRGGGNIAAFLGEYISRLPFEGAEVTNTYDHDFRWQGTTFDTKTKDRTVPPSLDYDASVAAYNTRQQADYYIFVSLLRDKASGRYTRGYIIGIYPQADYKKDSTFWSKGDFDPSNGWTVSTDCYNLPYRSLIRFSA
jgi:hypothetical protein